MGRRYWSAEAFNCSAPDTGNTEVHRALRHQEQQARWLQPLLEGEIRSSFAMTEPAVASSDATNIECSIRRDGDDYVINGRKWYITGAMNERCKLFILMGKTDPDNADRHRQQSMIIVPRDTPGITMLRDMALHGPLRRALRPPRGAVRERARAGVEHPAGRGPRLRDRAGPPRPRAHPPLHAHDRHGRSRRWR
jgi:hypothetical protein